MENVQDKEEREKVFSKCRNTVSELARGFSNSLLEKKTARADSNEEVYSRNRDEITHEAQNSTKPLNIIIQGFFDHRDHLHKQAIHLTGVQNMRETIKENWGEGMQKMEEYIKKKDLKGQIKHKVREAETKCHTDYSGSTTFKEITIVRGLADLLDKDGRGILLLSNEESVQATGPFLKVIEKPDR